MNRLIATASALALLAGTGIGYAANSSTNTNANNSSASMPNSAMQSAAAPMRLSQDQVRQVQQQLQSAGLYNGQIDGKMGPETKQALQQFQQQNGLQASGNVDQQTMAALSGNASNSGSGMAPNMQPSAAGGNSGTSAYPNAQRPDRAPMNPSAAPTSR